MVVDLMKLEKAAKRMSCFEGLHFEYCFTENGGQGQIFLGNAGSVVFSTRELPSVAHDVVRFTAKRLNMSEQTLRRWVELQKLDDLSCDALTKNGQPCQNPTASEHVPADPRTFDPTQKFFCSLHGKAIACP